MEGSLKDLLYKPVFMILRFTVLEHIQKKMMQILKKIPKREFQTV